MSGKWTAYANTQKKGKEFIHLNNKYLLAIYISTVLDAWNIAGNKTDKIPKFTSLSLQSEEIDNKYDHLDTNRSC